MHTLQPGGEEGPQAECTTAAVGQQGSQQWVMGEHLVDQRRPVPVFPQDKSSNQFLGNKDETTIMSNNNGIVRACIVDDKCANCYSVCCTSVTLYL